MKLNDILNNITEASTSDFEQKSHRRSLLKSTGAKLAAAAIPFAAGTLFSNKANAQSKETIINSLNYLLKLESVIGELFKQALATNGLIPTQLVDKFEQMAKQNEGHVTSLSTIIQELGGTAQMIDASDIDLTGDSGNPNTVGPFVDSLYSFDNLLIHLQMLCDGGTRMYKGQTFEVMSDNATVTALMKIHSVKARQASYIRFVRNFWYKVDIKPWITNANSDTTNTAVQRAYAGEAALSQRNIPVVGINGFEISTEAASQAFDEPLNMDDGNNMINRFIVR